MRSTRDIYDEYRIPPWLQLHQLRVAAVGKMVCEGLGVGRVIGNIVYAFTKENSIFRSDDSGQAWKKVF